MCNVCLNKNKKTVQKQHVLPGTAHKKDLQHPFSIQQQDHKDCQ